MKKTITFCIATVIILLIAYYSINNLLNSELALYKQVPSTEIEKMIQENETFIAYFYQKNCPSCKQIKPILNNFIEESGKDIFAVDINSDDHKNLLIQDFEIQGTPTVIFYKSGEEKFRFISVFNKEEFDEKANLIFKE
ncbi:thioredoxin family protein [Paenibacillus solani]|uniref:thioredoxin family protein n=1 Tax=Paenibacillus solani TaxID=1705565 RepID=UPI003D2E447E